MTYQQARECVETITANARREAKAMGLDAGQTAILVSRVIENELATALIFVDDPLYRRPQNTVEPPAVVSIQPVAISGPGS